MKYNRSNIARRANALARSMSRSLAWRKAWAEAKIARLDKEMDSHRNSRPAIWMPIREARFTAMDALAMINREAEAASPIEAMKSKLFVLKMADRPSYEERQEITRLERLLAA